MAGLLAARVLSDHFDSVRILERDPVSEEPVARKGQSQGRHLHVLLSPGFRIIGELFPGIQEELVEGGSTRIDFGERMRWHEDGVWKQQFPSGLESIFQSRPYLEAHVRRRTLAIPNIEIIDSCRVVGLSTDTEKTRVQGVKVVFRNEGDREETLAAELTVDCSGRSSSTPKWLEELGYEAPTESRLNIDFAYSSKIYRRTDPDPSPVMIVASPPAKRGTFMTPIEDMRWVVTAGGIHGVRPPTDDAGFLQYVKDLAVPTIYDVIKDAEPLSEIVPYRFPYGVRRHYERLKRFPEGHLVLGDAVQSANPLYAQGMAAAALQSMTLKTALEAGVERPKFRKHYFKALGKFLDIPWQMAVGEDFRWPETTGDKPFGTNLLCAYTGHLHRLMGDDKVIYEQFLKVMNLVEPPTSLLHPRILWRAARRSKRQ